MTTTMHVDAFNVAHTTVGCDQFNGEYVGSIPLDKCAANHMAVCADCEPRTDVHNAIAHARVTGSVACTYNGTQAQRLYVSTGGIDPRYTMTGWWLITHPDGTTEMREA